MALSLPGERSVAAGSHAHPVRALFDWLAQVKTNRARRTALQGLLDMDTARLRDLGIDRSDIADAMLARNARTPGMVLNAARSRNALT
ncbi:MAG: hypothetical protein KIT02_16765 [Devosia sp.]|uniref:hypothetical protein n=1 Tax=Devosia sp. TaxID=1871048 RepID=UPI0024C53E60|nr:hypothetical protein [Devosia sp.]UYN99533.1 MAG: hypothetical protein KIT02_16765 [Devosia sp.]